MKRLVFTIALLTFGLFGARNASAASIYFNGFETDTSGWVPFAASLDAARVPSGTGGITSATGSFHAVNSATGSAGNWGGYNYGAGALPTAFQEYTTGVNIFLDVNGGWANNTRFDFDSAINNAAGTFLRDFIFNCGFYNDADLSPGSGTNRFICTASNNSQPGGAFAKNPLRDPIAISTTGWYDFQTHFYNNGGVLAADLSIYDSSNVLVHTWTLSDPTDLIATVGGNRYGYFTYDQFGANLAFDNARLDTAAAAAVPEPATLVLFGLGLVGTAVKLRRKVKAAA